MAQLSPDHFAFAGGLLAVEDAIARASANLRPVAETERLQLLYADGRVLAADHHAPINLPPFFNSAVDGYAVRFEDLATDGETRLGVAGRTAAGEGAGRLPPGTAMRIFTGAPMPEGANTVFMQEDVTNDGETVILPPGLKFGANCRPVGEDIAAGMVALKAGTRITPEAIALLAALGDTHVTVRRRPRVAVFSTGNEIQSPGTPLKEASVYDANRFMLQVMLRRLGCAVTDLGILPDNRERVVDALSAAAQGHDLILTSGGVSTGEEDHVKAAVERTGRLTLWRLAIKPGRPVAMGVIQGRAFIGLPGNPVAVFVTFAHVVRPFLAALSGAEFTRPLALPVTAGFDYRKKEGRREYVRVRLETDRDGHPVARKHPREGAGVITSLTETDGLVELPEPVTTVTAGQTVGFIAYSELR